MRVTFLNWVNPIWFDQIDLAEVVQRHFISKKIICLLNYLFRSNENFSFYMDVSIIFKTPLCAVFLTKKSIKIYYLSRTFFLNVQNNVMLHPVPSSQISQKWKNCNWKTFFFVILFTGWWSFGNTKTTQTIWIHQFEVFSRLKTHLRRKDLFSDIFC